jgi:hypothetical protein
MDTASLITSRANPRFKALHSLVAPGGAKRTHTLFLGEKLILQLRGALAEVRTLSGMLPICSSCKKIRDDKGYWSQIESYISEHSRAEFSHGICPECEKKVHEELNTLMKEMKDRKE